MSSEPQVLSAENGQIRSVAKALAILDLLASAGREMALGEIVRETGLAKSTAHGLLATLKAFRYVEQPLDGRYKLGVRLFELGSVVANTWDVRQIAAPYSERLVEEFGETVHLAVLDQDRVLYIDKRENKRSIRIVSQVGTRLPAHCSGLGKVLLAHLAVREVRRIVASRGLQRFTSRTITDPDQLEAELAKVRQQGYAVDNEEIMEGLRCVAAPIRDHTGKVCAAVSISGPVSHLAEERFDLAVSLVTNTAAEISSGLGYSTSKNGGAVGLKGVSVPTA